jgi:hypothetical protein
MRCVEPASRPSVDSMTLSLIASEPRQIFGRIALVMPTTL